jgi:hypothetical protein
MTDRLEVAALSVCVYEAITARERAGRSVPPFMNALAKKLEAEVGWHEALYAIASDLVDDVPVMSRSGPPLNGNRADLGPDKKISASQAAEILNCSRRHVARISTSLDGELVCGRWLFPESSVLEYRDCKEEHARSEEFWEFGEFGGAA